MIEVCAMFVQDKFIANLATHVKFNHPFNIIFITIQIIIIIVIVIIITTNIIIIAVEIARVNCSHLFTTTTITRYKEIF